MKLRVRCRLRVYVMDVVTTELFPNVLRLPLETTYEICDSSIYTRNLFQWKSGELQEQTLI